MSRRKRSEKDAIPITGFTAEEGPAELKDKMDRAFAVKQEYEAYFLAKANVVGVGVGLRQKDGEWTDTVALVVIVQRKIGETELDEQDVLPHEINGIPVDVQEVGVIQA